MKTQKKIKYTIKHFNTDYPDDEACLHDLFLRKHKNSKTCSECENKFSYYKVTNRKCYACAFCAKQLSPTAGTIFHKSSTSLKSWFYAIFLFSNSKNGVSAKELERQLGVTYKTAWRMAKQIRKLFDDKVEKLRHDVEIDETYQGGAESNKHYRKKTKHTQGRSTKTKTPILGAVERQGHIVAKVVTDTKHATIMPFVREQVEITANINTDEYKSYQVLSALGYDHTTVDHGRKQFVKGSTHTNTIEGFWSQLKRSINGTYHSVSPKYLQTYVNEFAYRYNRRYAVQPLFKGIIHQTVKNCQ